MIESDEIEKYKTARLKGGRRVHGKKGETRETGRGVKPATVNRDLACMKAMYNYFISLGVIVKNPVAKVKLLPENNNQTRVLSFEEERLYLAACGQPLYDIAVLMLETGMRPDEIYRMKRENVNLVAGFVFNPHGKTKAARRKLTLTNRAADVLKLRMLTIEGDYLFPSADPAKPMPSADRLHNAALELSGIDHCRLYDLRHTFCTRAVEAGVDLVTLAALCGHSRIQMVLRYAHPTEEHQVKAIRKMEEYTIARQMEDIGMAATVQ